MPYASQAQRKFFHTATAKKKGISTATVNEFDRASRGTQLPARRTKSPHDQALHGLRKAIGVGR